MHHNTKNKFVDLALMGMMVAILDVAKISLMAVPNVEIVSLLIVLFTIMIGKKNIPCSNCIFSYGMLLMGLWLMECWIFLYVAYTSVDCVDI